MVCFDRRQKVSSPSIRPLRQTKKQVNVIFLLIGISLVVAVGFLAAFLWAMRDGQYEDDVTPSMRMLHDAPLKDDQTVKKQNNEA